MTSPRLPPKISFKDNWMKEWRLPTNPTKIKNPIIKHGETCETEQPSRSSAQEIDKRFLFDFESTSVRTARPVNSRVPVSVERLDQDKDADENVDADQIRT